MEKVSSCIAVFTEHTDAEDAVRQLLSFDVNEDQILLVSKDQQQGGVATKGLLNLDDDLYKLGVRESSLYCYKCLVHNGSFLVIVSGNYEEVERACNQLEKQKKADVSIHFDAV